MSRSSRHQPSELDLQILSEYEGGDTSTAIAARYHTSARAITAAIRRAGGQVRSRTHSTQLRHARERELAAGASGSYDSLPLSASGEKRCSGCHQVKSLSEFGRDRGAHDGHDTRCKECDRNRFNNWLANHKNAETLRQKWRDNRLFRKFGINREQYNAMSEAQGGVCAICGEPEPSSYQGKKKLLAVDHSHDTGIIRSLCCSHCNKGLGCFKDSPALLEAAAAYLRKHAANASRLHTG